MSNHTQTEWIMLGIIVILLVLLLRLLYASGAITQQRDTTMHLLHHTMIDLGKYKKRAGELDPTQERLLAEAVKASGELLRDSSIRCKEVENASH